MINQVITRMIDVLIDVGCLFQLIKKQFFYMTHSGLTAQFSVQKMSNNISLVLCNSPVSMPIYSLSAPVAPAPTWTANAI